MPARQGVDFGRYAALSYACASGALLLSWRAQRAAFRPLVRPWTAYGLRGLGGYPLRPARPQSDHGLQAPGCGGGL